MPLEGGWRVYSSGPGLVLRLVTEVLLGIRQRGDDVEVDPVLPPGDGASELVAQLPLAGRPPDGPLRRRAARATASAASPSAAASSSCGR